MSIFKVTIYSEISEFPTEKRYDAGINILELKKKLELITGANYLTMKVSLSIGDEEIGELADNDKTLSDCVGDRATPDAVLKLTVKDGDSSKIFSGDAPKFNLSEEKYLQRSNNARDFIKEMRAKRQR